MIFLFFLHCLVWGRDAIMPDWVASRAQAPDEGRIVENFAVAVFVGRLQAARRGKRVGLLAILRVKVEWMFILLHRYLVLTAGLDPDLPDSLK